MLPEKPWKQMKPKDVWFMIHVLAKQDQETRTRLPTTWILHLWTPPTNFRSTVCAIIQSMGQLANICICALGGSFHLSKCSWRCFVPTKSRGKPDVIDIEQDLQIFPTQDSPAETILHLSKGTSHCQLRVQVVPSLSPKSQLALLQQKCRTFSLQIRRNSLSPHQSSVVYEHYIAPAIQFPCITHAIPSTEIDSLQNLVLCLLLSKFGIATTF